jgi:hypothetical protein
MSGFESKYDIPSVPATLLAPAVVPVTLEEIAVPSEPPVSGTAERP